MATVSGFPVLNADEAAGLIDDGSLVGFSGFTPAGAAKAVPLALASRAERLHSDGLPYQLRVLTGASTGEDLDEALARAEAIAWRAPYQSSATLRKQVNAGRAQFVDMHLSTVPSMVAAGHFGRLDWAVIEATDVTADGRVYLTTSIGGSPTFLKYADRVILEVNRRPPPRLSQMADIVVLPPPHQRQPLPISDPLDKIGFPYASVDPSKIVGVVETDLTDRVPAFSPPDAISRKIAEHVVRFLIDEMRAGRVPEGFLPLQAGVGNVANAVMEGLGREPAIPPFAMYSEVFQDSLLDLMNQGKLTGISTTSLTLSDSVMADFFTNLDDYVKRVVLRPQELSNNPEVIRRLGVIALNTALEVDIYGHVNSTHVCGTKIINGIGGSGDFARNAAVPIFMCPSIVKGGKISSIVPMASHIDHSEHSTRVIVTEQGLADLRGLSAEDRAKTIIDQCAHPAFRDYLHRYRELATVGHICHDLDRCFELHRNLLQHGAMLPDLDLSGLTPED